MATHKVPQDVEADDKLVGFLSLKQFIFTVLGIGFGYLTFLFFTQVHPIASLVWLPFCMVFFVLGLYQRKDQPVEVYLLSALRFYLKPHRRIWDQEGFEERVIITAPPKLEQHLTKNFSQQEVSSRLDNLSLLMDTRGWAAKQITQTPAFSSVSSDRIVQATDIVMPHKPDLLTSAALGPDMQEGLDAVKIQAQLSQSTNEGRMRALATLEQARQGNDTTSGVPDAVPAAPLDAAQQSTASMPATNPTAMNDSNQTKPDPVVDVTEPGPIVQNDGSVEIKLH